MSAQAFFSSFAFDQIKSRISGWSTFRMTILAARRVLPPDLMTPAKASRPFIKETGPLALPPGERCSLDERRLERLEPVREPYLNSIPSGTANCIMERRPALTRLSKNAAHWARPSL